MIALPTSTGAVLCTRVGSVYLRCWRVDGQLLWWLVYRGVPLGSRHGRVAGTA